MSRSFYVTTPIYYVNDKPHIGHAYTTLLADVLARSHRLLGEPTFFLTGTDEHGQKVAQAAAKRGVDPQQHCDEYVLRFKELWERLNVTHDRFIRTTEQAHKDVVRGILQTLFDQGEIYRDEYEGWYCVSEERFVTDKDLTDQKDDQGRVLAKIGELLKPVERISEGAYYFKMAKHQQWLIDYIEANPTFIQPDYRRNETLGFLRSQDLGDLCISRPKERLSWGIELPFDTDFVTYVWFDALVNYITGVGFRMDAPTNEEFSRWWPAQYHLIGKDILTTHTVYWPIMLKAIGVPQPLTIFAHGWWLMRKSATGADEKMSKSEGTVVDPMQMADDYGADALRYFLMAEMTPGQDATFSQDLFVVRYNADLADSLGNMVNRVVKFIAKQGGLVPAPGELNEEDILLRDAALAAVDGMAESIREMRIDRGLYGVLEVVRHANRYFEINAPWKLAKANDTERLGTVLYCAAEAMRIVAGLLYPVMPEKMTALRVALGLPDAEHPPTLADLSIWGNLPAGIAVRDLTGLFPKIDVKKLAEAAPANAVAAKVKSSGDAPRAATEKAKTQQAKPAETQESAGLVELVDITEFGRINLRTARVVEAAKVDGSSKLLCLKVEINGEERQIVAGIAKHYTPEALVGRLVVVVANLKPAMLFGVESNGMLLAAKAGKQLKLIAVDGGDFATGASVG